MIITEPDNTLLRILEKYTNRKNNSESRKSKWRHGFMPISIPTGTSKTYTMNQMIYNYSIQDFDNEDDRRSIIVTTSLNNVLPEDDLREMFKKNGKENLFNRLFLRLPSVSKNVLEKYDTSMNQSIVDCLGAEVANNFINVMKLYRNAEPKYRKSIENEFREKTEPYFRRVLKEELMEIFPEFDDRFLAVTTDKKWVWVSVLYPSVYTSRRRIFFLSADKFIMGNDTVIGNNESIFHSKILADAIVFIDEVDGVKRTFMKRKIDQNLRYQVNSLVLFETIRMNLNRTHPDIIYSSSCVPERISRSQEIESFQKKRFDYIDKKYCTAFSLKIGDDTVAKKLTLFHSSSTFVLDGEEGKYYRASPTKEKQLIVEECERSKANLSSLFNEVYWAIESFAKYISYIAMENYHSYHEKQVYRYEYDDLIISALREYGIRGDDLDYLLNYILLHTPKAKKFGKMDVSFYRNGYKYNALHDDLKDPVHSDVATIWQDTTPEAVLFCIAERAFVIGLSATAKLDTVLDNFDLNYLKAVLGEDYIELKEESEELRHFVEHKWEHYDKVSIHTSFVFDHDQNGKYSEKLWEDTIHDNDARTYILGMMRNIDEYHIRRYLRAAKIFRKFISEPMIHSFIAFFNKLADDSEVYDSMFQESILEMIFDAIWDEYFPDDDSKSPFKDNVFIVSSENAKEQYEVYSERLRSGRKALILTTYQTLSAGQNIQYPFDDISKVVSISDDVRAWKKDFDAIYVDRPTNIIPQFSDTLPNLMNAKQELIFLMKYLHYNGEISNAQFVQFLGFVMWNKTLKFNAEAKPLMLSTPSARLSSARNVIQAIGRISRTIYKNPDIYVFADPGLIEVFTEAPEVYGITNKESEALIKMISDYSKGTLDEKVFINRAKNSCDMARQNIEMMMHFDIPENREQWKELREYCLCNPTTDDVTLPTEICYVRLPDNGNMLWYHSGRNWKDLKISLKYRSSYETVSEDSARLSEISRIPGIPEYFASKGYPLMFENSKYILSPVMFKEIYKGALGEVVGRFILNGEFLTYPMSDELFEKFDECFENGDPIDYKHWNSDGFKESATESYRKHIVQKLLKVGRKTGYVLNLFRINDQIEIDTDCREGVTVVYSYLWDAVRNCPNTKLFEYIRGEMK